jgi:uncharacterized damage-inducible protein DinB
MDHDPAVSMLLDAFSRTQEAVPRVLDSMSPEDLLWRPDAGSNSIGWLVWHLTRVQDDHLAGLAERSQVWTDDGWAERFGLPYPADAIGYGQDEDDVAAFDVTDPALLSGYADAVHERTVEIVSQLTADDLARVVDERWDPPVTVAVRLVSVVDDMAQHVGQAAYLHGLLERRRA